MRPCPNVIGRGTAHAGGGECDARFPKIFSPRDPIPLKIYFSGGLSSRCQGGARESTRKYYRYYVLLFFIIVLYVVDVINSLISLFWPFKVPNKAQRLRNIQRNIKTKRFTRKIEQLYLENLFFRIFVFFNEFLNKKMIPFVVLLIQSPLLVAGFRKIDEFCIYIFSRITLFLNVKNFSSYLVDFFKFILFSFRIFGPCNLTVMCDKKCFTH